MALEHDGAVKWTSATAVRDRLGGDRGRRHRPRRRRRDRPPRPRVRPQRRAAVESGAMGRRTSTRSPTSTATTTWRSSSGRGRSATTGRCTTTRRSPTATRRSPTSTPTASRRCWSSRQTGLSLIEHNGTLTYSNQLANLARWQPASIHDFDGDIAAGVRGQLGQRVQRVRDQPAAEVDAPSRTGRATRRAPRSTSSATARPRRCTPTRSTCSSSAACRPAAADVAARQLDAVGDADRGRRRQRRAARRRSPSASSPCVLNRNISTCS
jgi:hypothetical protein